MGLLFTVAALPSCNSKEDSLGTEKAQARKFYAVLEQPVADASR